MNTVHTLREYVDALRDAGILVESTVSDELAAREIHCLTYDTRALSEDALFICKGAHFKEEYLCDALSRSAIAYVAEKKHNVDAPCLLVNDIRYSLVVLGQLFYNHVTDKLTSVGITGTKGKSTTAYYVRYILNDWLRAQSMPECAILSSIDNYDGKSTEESHITTPERNHTPEVYKLCYSAVDLTTLSCTDSVESVTEFAGKAVKFYQQFPHLPNVASICIYPPFVETVGVVVDGTDMRITSVAGGFPSSQTFLEVKVLEVAMAVENGADEIDIVLNVGKMLEGHYDEVANEVEVIRTEMSPEVVLKVIIESGALKTPDLIRKASLLSMFAGADFVKTSTGKIDVSATPEAAVVMCQAIRDYYRKTGRKVGFKPAGGVRSAEDAALYYTIVEEILGKEWLTPELFRIGASSAANNLLTAIEGREVKFF